MDNSKEKTQKAIIQSISKEIGSNKIVSVDANEKHDMFYDDMKIKLLLDLDLRPSSLLVGEEEGAVEFEWTSEVLF